MTAPEILTILEVVSSVHTTLYGMVHVAVSESATILRSLALKLVKDTNRCGTITLFVMDVNPWLALIAWSADQKLRTSPGYPLDLNVQFLMMKLALLIDSAPLTSCPPNSTVLKPSVLHVVLSLHGPS